MLIDNTEVLSDAQALTATAVSTHKYDLGVASSKVGAGRALGIGFFIDVAADGTSANETYVFNLVSDGDAALGSPTIHETRAIPFATLVAGYKFFMSYDQFHDAERYLGATFTLGGTTPSVTVTAVLMTAQSFESWKAYPNNY